MYKFDWEKFILQGYLNEDPTDVFNSMTDYGIQKMYTVGNIFEVGDAVKLDRDDARKERVFVPCADADFDGILSTDPIGRISTDANGQFREGLITYPRLGFNYHLPIINNVDGIEAGDIISWQGKGTGWVKIDDYQKGYNFIAVEKLEPNKTGYIDCYLKIYKND